MTDVAILGGTGDQGRGLASRFARAGHRVTIGSREAQRAVAAAHKLRDRFGAGLDVTGADNLMAVADADIVVISVPFETQGALLQDLGEALAGTIVVSCVNPIAFDDAGPYAPQVPEGSAAEQAADLVPAARLVAAFHHLSARSLLEGGPVHDESVLVCSDDAEARARVIELAGSVAARGGIDAGPLRNARHLEAFTAVLIEVNRTYRRRSGLAITGL